MARWPWKATEDRSVLYIPKYDISNDGPDGMELMQLRAVEEAHGLGQGQRSSVVKVVWSEGLCTLSMSMSLNTLRRKLFSL